MLRHDSTNTAEDSTPSRAPSPSQRSNDSADSSPAPPSRAISFDAASTRSYRLNPLPATPVLDRRHGASPNFALGGAQPQAILNMSVIQEQAERLEAQTRRDMEETQRLADQHFEEMLDSRGYRVTHACEHCRQRKAKCSGELPCQRCAKQGILCRYSKHERLGKFAAGGGSEGLAGGRTATQATVGPMRMERGREERRMTVPYGLRRVTVLCAPTDGLLQGWSSTGVPALPLTRDTSAASSFPPAQPVRPTPMHPDSGAPLRSPVITTVGDKLPPPRSDSPQARPWTAELNPRRHTPTRSLPDPLTHLNRIPPLPSTLGSIWCDSVPLLPVLSSGRRPSDQYATQDFDETHSGSSIETNLSQDVATPTMFIEDETVSGERLMGAGVVDHTTSTVLRGPRNSVEAEGANARQGAPDDHDPQQ